jgi:pilus assembly protein FimV
MRAASTLSVIGTALWLASASAQAVGFGRVSNATQLGQPLSFVAAVRLDPDEILTRECVSAEVQSGETKLQPEQVRVTLEGAANSTERSVRVTTGGLIDEPVVTVSITLGCDARVTRRFVAFIDPPLINAAQTAPVEPQTPQRVDSQVAPITAMVLSANPPAPRRAERPAPARRSARAAASATAPASTVATDNTINAAPTAPAAERPKRPATRQPRVARAAPTGSRLQLEAAAPLVARSASAPAASVPTPVLAAAAPASAPKPDDTAEQLAKERQRIQSLEEGLAKLRADSQATQAALVTLQASLKAAETERYANPLVFALAGLAALLALLVAGLWWRQSRARSAAHWWAGPAPAPVASSAPLAAAAAEPVEPVASAPSPLSLPQTAADVFDVSTMVEEDEAPRVPERPRELSVEELIDLEQQAEFFVVLGQDEAAIELLMSHVRSDGGNSPLPYLKLLEIYRRRGDGDAYQRIRERFNRRFNSYAPDWDSDLQQGRSLVDYPDTIAQLQRLWASPTRAMGTLDASLFRRNKTDETFDLPAYRELLFLYSIARDLAEHDGALPSTHVDLLLPLDDPGEEPISRLSANTKSGDIEPPAALMTMPLDLDVSFAPGATQPTEATPAAPRGPGERPVDSIFIDFDLAVPANAPKSGNR